jgi:hypothetical protein
MALGPQMAREKKNKTKNANGDFILKVKVSSTHNNGRVRNEINFYSLINNRVILHGKILIFTFILKVVRVA